MRCAQTEPGSAFHRRQKRKHMKYWIFVVLFLLGATVSYAQYNVAPPTSCPTGQSITWDGANWSCAIQVPSGSIFMFLTGCPSGFSEVQQAAGSMLLSTTAGQQNAGSFSSFAVITPSTTNILNSQLGGRPVLGFPQAVPDALNGKFPTTIRVILCQKN